MILKLLDSLSKFLTGLVTLLASASNGLTKADRGRLLMLCLIATFFELAMVTDIVFLWLFLKP
jgi:hypothetical protein